VTDATATVDHRFAFLAVCQHYWGRGNTPDAAKKRLKTAGGSLREKWFLILVIGDDTPEVNQMGHILIEADATYRIVGGSHGWEKAHNAVKEDA
jgi:hypothetical protein